MSRKNEIEVLKYKNGKIIPEKIFVTEEYQMELSINGVPLALIACSKENLEPLAVGYLLSENIIRSKKDIKKIDLNEEDLKVNVDLSEELDDNNKITELLNLSAAGGKRGRKRGLPGDEYIRKNLPMIDAAVIAEAMERFLTTSDERPLTFGVHSAALYTLAGEEKIFFNEIGRHNAVDKVIGYSLLNDIDLREKMLFSSGRVSSEILFKLIYSSFPILVSRASPTSYSLELAKKYNLILLCRARDYGFIILNGKEHINI